MPAERFAMGSVAAGILSAALLGGLLAAALAGAKPAAAGSPASKPAKPGLRVITYNIHAFDPVAATDDGRARIADVRACGQLLRRYAMELALHRPDVVALQEASPKKLVEQLAAALKMHVAFFPGGWKNKGWPDGIAGAILTRLPILEAADRPGVAPYQEGRNLFSRHFGRVLIRAGGRKIAVYTAHLLPTYKNTTHVRLGEIRAVAAAARADRKARRSVIVLGDMNHRPSTPEYRAWIDAGFTDAFAAKGRGGPLTCSNTKLEERIDYVWTMGPVVDRLQACRVLREGAFRCHLADPTSWALSDHLPVLAEFE